MQVISNDFTDSVLISAPECVYGNMHLFDSFSRNQRYVMWEQLAGDKQLEPFLSVSCRLLLESVDLGSLWRTFEQHVFGLRLGCAVEKELQWLFEPDVAFLSPEFIFLHECQSFALVVQVLWRLDNRFHQVIFLSDLFPRSFVHKRVQVMVPQFLL